MMLTCPTHVPIYFYAKPVDLRKSFDGLCGLIESAFGLNVVDGHLFLFVNKRQDRIKAIWFETGGLVIWYKRLETERLSFPRSRPNKPISRSMWRSSPCCSRECLWIMRGDARECHFQFVCDTQLRAWH